ncbi:hypothetical protein WDW86_06550 [Bdellovibrionota bacterium FG-2]
MRNLWVLLFLVSTFARADLVSPVLFIGDSHSAGPFGAELERLLDAKGMLVNRTACVGASTMTYLKGGTLCKSGSVTDGKVADYKAPTINALLSQAHPSSVVVALGANMYDTLGWTSKQRVETVRQLTEAIRVSGAACVWVGPKYGPNATFEEAGQVLSDIEQGVTGECQVIDSRPLAEFNWCGDKVCCCNVNPHYNAHGPEGIAAAKKWALNVVGKLGLE